MPVEAGVTVVLMVVVGPDEVPACGTGWGGGTVAGDGIPVPPCGADVLGTELGGGTLETGG